MTTHVSLLNEAGALALRNPQLVLAAPDLLAALQLILPLAEDLCRDEEIYTRYGGNLFIARAAIAKAEGTS